MNDIPILNIQQFEHELPSNTFYSNVLSRHLERNAKIIHKPHKHDFYLCVLFTQGTGIHNIDFRSFKVHPGSVFFLKPGQTHFWSFDTPPEGYIFFHTSQFYQQYFPQERLKQFPFYGAPINPPHLELQAEAIESIAIRFKDIFEEYDRQHLFKAQKLAHLIAITYIDLSRLYSTTFTQNTSYSARYVKTLEAFESLIESHYKAERSVQFYADRLNMTTKHLNRITKTTINKTAISLINQRVILEAKRFLVQTSMPLTEIAENLGFEDYAYFSRMFKQKTGHAPLSFKKHYQPL